MTSVYRAMLHLYIIRKSTAISWQRGLFNVPWCLLFMLFCSGDKRLYSQRPRWYVIFAWPGAATKITMTTTATCRVGQINWARLCNYY